MIKDKKVNLGKTLISEMIYSKNSKINLPTTA